MNNKLWVKCLEDGKESLYTFYVAIGCSLKDAIADIEEEHGIKVLKASYNRQKVK